MHNSFSCPLRVAQVLPVDFSQPGGMQVHVACIARELRQRGYAVHVIGRKGDWYPDLTFVSPERFDPQNYDIVHTHGQFGARNFSYRQRRCCVVHTYHGTTLSTRWATRRLLSLLNPRNYLSVWQEAIGGHGAHRCIGVSRQAVWDAHQLYRVPFGKMTFIPNGHAVQRPSDERLQGWRERYGIGADDFVFLFVGRDDDYFKGAWRAVRAFAECAAAFPHARLLMAPGVREYRHPQIIRTGVLPSSEVGELYFLADALVSSSFAEGFALVLVEAMGAGLPVVATAVGGATDLIVDGENGLLVNRTCRDLPDAMRRLLTQPELRERLSQGAARTAPLFTWAAVAERITAFYQQVMDEVTA
jgi:glycosyltransferase involved in cell wall biosynthesis